MKGYCFIISMFLLFILRPLISGTNQDGRIALQLDKGDELLYEIRIEKIQNHSDFNREPLNKNIEQKTRLNLKVKDIPEPGIYLFSYQKLYTRYYTSSKEGISSTDSRFPEYGRELHPVISAYLNSVEYSVLLNTKEGRIALTNLDQIKKGLAGYLESRGIELNGHARLEIDYFTGEEKILEDLGVFNFYPGEHFSREWANTQADGNREEFYLIGESDTSFHIRSEVPEFSTLPDHQGIKQISIRLPRELIVDSETGILLQAKSLPQKNYQYKLELLSCSKWKEATIICGQIHGSKIQRLCLEYKSFMVGNEVDHIYVETKTDGSFSIPVDINEPFRYRLYLLEQFPVNTNKHIHLYAEPGDSIYLLFSNNEFRSPRFSGKGYENSEFLDKRNLDSKTTSLLSIYSPIYYPPQEFFKSLEQSRESLKETEILLQAERSRLTQGFFEYMLSEIHSLENMFEMAEDIRKVAESKKTGKAINSSFPEIKWIQAPYYEYTHNLEQFPNYASQYARFSFYQLLMQHKGRYGYDTRSEQMALSRIVLEGYPLYASLVNQLKELAKMSDRQWSNYKIQFGDFLENCNNIEISKYVTHRLEQIELLQPGNEIPEMNLLDLDGKKWNWNKTRGKIVVLMLFGDYNSAHYACEDLYKEYGYNKKDVIILRISPGISFQHWKSFNTRYSTRKHQMYFSDGEEAFNDRFLSSFWNKFGVLIIDREGKIFRNTDLTNEKAAIKAAIALPPPPGKPFMETTLARILLGTLLGILLSFSIYRIIIHRRLRQKALENRMSELEQKAMKAQLNPHFLFNSLNSIQRLIRSKQLKDAESYLTTFASLIRKILDHSEKESITISEELNTIKLYIKLEQMRFGFEYEIQTSPEIDVHNTMIPTMMFQPIVENAILHGLAPKKGEKKIALGAEIEHDLIVFKIEDNGIGRAASSKENQEHQSKGLNIIQSRIEILNRAEPGKYKLKITDLEDQNHKALGTLVEISFPDEK